MSCRACGHADHSAPCGYETWDDGQWFEGVCGCLGEPADLPKSNGQPQLVPVNHGVLRIDVWPTYMGVGESTDGVTLLEFVGNPDYERGMITWEPDPGGDIVGRARVRLPKGLYTHLLFCNGPTDLVVGVEQLEHPLVFETAGIFDIDPIHNRTYLPRR